MKPQEVEDRLRAIQDCSGDDEAAHSREDDLHVDVLRAIANGDYGEASELAALALKTLDIEFARWCA